ncbi:hypothetical protein [Streptomyces flavofungini]|uniref:Secreted protein n=1 Tax=Streptomyces flavofungini TaxID=68200 RepID=A0ABS0X8H9_9ACTN|nr:hypothetical protein [Streptomyces flavofungini]MBJ3809516.1 hypothetical protein [Streptomyces flavofungini]GHC55236.1 hypothetical protein GCM10010349_21810 [Streptomyces flavofungini]
MKIAKVPARVLLPLAGAALATAALAAPATAAPQHWTDGEVHYADSRSILTPYDGTQGARAVLRVDWETGKGGVYGNLWDLKKDGYDATLQAGYSWLDGSTWKPATRTLNTVKDASDSGRHTSLHTDPAVKIKDLKVRVCTVDSAGAQVWCGDWH